MSDDKSILLAKISSHSASVGVIGLGYLGLPLALVTNVRPGVDARGRTLAIFEGAMIAGA